MVSLKNIIFGGLFIFMVAAPVMAIVSPQTSAASSTSCEDRVLGIPPWYRGLTKNNPPACDMKSPNDAGGLSAYIWHIVLNVIEMAVVIVAYVAVFFILYGGFQFIVGGSNPSMIEKARKTILNAVIGLVVAMAAIGITNLIFSIIK